MSLKTYCKEFIHNVIVHPLMMFLPLEFANQLHDKNANWAFKERYDEMYLEGRHLNTKKDVTYENNTSNQKG